MAQQIPLRAASLETCGAPELMHHRSVERAHGEMRATRSPDRRVNRMP